MLFAEPLVWKATLCTLIAVFFILVCTWWLYLSPLKLPVEGRNTPSTQLAGWLATLLALSGLLLIIGGLWDGSMHIKTGEIPAGADFLWPPHLLIYGSFLLSFIVAGVAVALVAIPSWHNGVHDPRRWVRGNPYLGAVALASIYELLAIPGDALWHEIVGVDLTAWSPPHLMLGGMSAAVMVSAVGLLVQARPALRRVGWANTAIVGLLALVLNMTHLVGLLDWEMPGSQAHAGRPMWLYPLVGGALALFTLILGKQLVPHRWTATAIALIYYLVRFSSMLGLYLTDNIVPSVPLIFILGAILLDVIPWQQVKSLNLQLLMTTVAFTASYLLVALPILSSRADFATFGTTDMVLAVALMLITGLACMLAASLTARLLLGTAKDAPGALLGQLAAPAAPSAPGSSHPGSTMALDKRQ